MFNEPLFSFSESRCVERVCVRGSCSFRNGVGVGGSSRILCSNEKNG